MWNKLKDKRITNSKRGSIFIEFAVVLPLLVFFLFMIIYMGLFMHDYVALNNITRSAARFVAVSTSGAKAAEGYTEPVMQRKTTNLKAYLNENEKGKLMLYNVNFDLISYVDSANLSSVENGDKGYVFSYVFKGNDGKTVNVVMKAVKSDDSPLLVDEFIPDVLTSALKMKLED